MAGWGSQTSCCRSLRTASLKSVADSSLKSKSCSNTQSVPWNVRAWRGSQLSARGVINDYHGAHACRLNDRLSLPAIPPDLSAAFNQQNVNRALIIVVTRLEKGVGIEQFLEPILHPAPANNSLCKAFGNKTRENSQLSFGRRSNVSSAIAHDVSIVH